MSAARPCWILVTLTVGCLLGAGRAQSINEMTQPLSLSGRVAVGYSQVSDNDFSDKGAATTIDANLTGYWKSPRIFAFQVSPLLNIGTSPGLPSLGGSINGFSSAATFLGGSRFPFGVSYSRMVSGDSSMVLGTPLNETGNTTSSLGFNWQLLFRGFPNLHFEYVRTNSDTEFVSLTGRNYLSDSDRFRVDANYNVARWELLGSYIRTSVDQQIPNLLDLEGNQLAESRSNQDLVVSAHRPFFRTGSLAVNANHSTWDSTYGVDDSLGKYDTIRASFTVRPKKRLSTSLFGSYLDTDQTTIAPPVPATTVSNTALNFGAGAGYDIGHGFNAFGSLGMGRSLVDIAGVQAPWTRTLAAGVNYSRLIGNTRSISAGYSFQQTNMSILATGSTNARSHSFFGGISGPIGKRWQGNASGSYSRATGEGSNSDSYTFTFNAQRPIGSWTIAGDVNLGFFSIVLPTAYDTESWGLGVSASSPSLRVVGRWQHSSGTVMQTLLPALDVSGQVLPKALLDPSAPVLPTTGNNWASLTGYYEPRGHHYTVSGTYGRYSYSLFDPSAVAANLGNTNSWYLNLLGGYRLRRLQLSAGYLRSVQLPGNVLARTYTRNTLYFMVIRNFKVL